jgi:hypothetical protein
MAFSWIESYLLAKKYIPTFVFHPDETTYPLSIQKLCEISFLRDRKKPDTIVGVIESPDDLFFKYNNENYYLDIQTKNVAYNHETPLYCVISQNREEKYIDLKYILLYAYNPGYKMCGFFKIGNHQGDLEHVTVRLNYDNKEIERVFFSAHGSKEGSWIDCHDLQMIGHSVVVYVSLYSHANYHTAKKVIRAGGIICINDITSKQGINWTPLNVELINDHTPWNNFKGNISNHTTKVPKKHSWYENEVDPSKHSNLSFWQRFFLCCN